MTTSFDQILSLLRRLGPQPTLTLAQRLCVKVSTVEQELGRLAAQGLVHKGEVAWSLGPRLECRPAPAGTALNHGYAGSVGHDRICSVGPRPRPPAEVRDRIVDAVRQGTHNSKRLAEAAGLSDAEAAPFLADLAHEGILVQHKGPARLDRGWYTVGHSPALRRAALRREEVFAVLTEGPAHIEMLSRRTGMGAPYLQSAVEAMLAEGRIARTEGAALGERGAFTTVYHLPGVRPARLAPFADSAPSAIGGSASARLDAQRRRLLAVLASEGPQFGRALRKRAHIGEAPALRALESLVADGSVLLEHPRCASNRYRLPHHEPLSAPAPARVKAPPPRRPLHLEGPSTSKAPKRPPEEVRTAARLHAAQISHRRAADLVARAKAKILDLLANTPTGRSYTEIAAKGALGLDSVKAALADLLGSGAVVRGERRPPRGRAITVYRLARKEGDLPRPALRASLDRLNTGPCLAAELDAGELLLAVRQGRVAVHKGLAYLTSDPDLAPVLTRQVGEMSVQYRPVAGGFEILEPQKRRGQVVLSVAALDVALGVGGSWRDKAVVSKSEVHIQ